MKRTSAKIWTVFGQRMLMASLSAFPLLARAQDRFGLNYATGAGLGTRDIRATVSTIINVVLGFVGIIFFAFMVIGGARWMISAGYENQIEEAKKSFTHAAVGLLIIFVAFALTRFAFSILERAT